MQHRMTITLDEEVYRDLRRMVPARGRSRFIANAIRPLLSQSEADLEAGYAAMAADELETVEGRDWIEEFIWDGLDENGAG
jgi:metal-responsive CopG/Arc/MetJ family transcriptional regulator